MLTAKQEAFCIAYIETGNASEAAVVSGLEFGAIPASSYYVYLLVDPRDGKIFYVGKGKGKRIKSHVEGARRGKIQNEPKHQAIMSVISVGLSVSEFVFAVFESEKDAYETERVLIEMFRNDGLTNICNGIETNEKLAQERARECLERVKTFSHWVATAGQYRLLSVLRISGSLSEYHREFVESLIRLSRYGAEEAEAHRERLFV